VKMPMHKMGPERLGWITQSAAVGLTVEPKVLALVRARFLWNVPYLERIQGVLDGVRRGPVGLPGPLELAALCLKRVAHL
jgi:hypothetical protein